MHQFAPSRSSEKLEWPLLLAILADYSQTEDGRARALALTAALDLEQIRDRWEAVEPLKILTSQGLKAPIGAMMPLGGIFRAAAKGQMLDGQALRAVAELLEATKRVYTFAMNYEARCSTLRKMRARTLPLPALLVAINRAVGPEGELLDDASPELSRIRRGKQQMRRRIEETLSRLLHGDQDLMQYLQDDFFTIRAERYVVPMKLDGRGRVKGIILDTSSSGQTLFIEPVQIAPLNAQLLDFELEEKLEIARIFRELSGLVEADTETLAHNYSELVELDFLMAQAHLAAEIHAGTVHLSAEPCLDLRDARHPLLSRSTGKAGIANSISLNAEQNILIVSGPNAGGKTVVLKTVGLLHLMAKAGLLLPAAAESRLFLFDNLYLEMGDAQNLSASLSTFSGHLMGLKPILEHAGQRDLVLLDELAVGTDPETGAAIGTAILERLAARRVVAIVTTHFDALKSLAIGDTRFRNGSMEFSLGTLSPTYRLLLDLPGQSFGLEVAEQIGLPVEVLNRAKELRHGQMSNLDKAVSSLMTAREEARAATAKADGEKLQAEAERLRWQQEVEMLRESRRKTAQQLTSRYEDRLVEMRSEFDETVKALRQNAKEQEQDTRAVLSGRKQAEQVLKQMGQTVSELQSGYDIEGKLPGQTAVLEQLAPNTPVFILPLKKAGRVLRVGAGGDSTIEVEVGILKLRVPLHDLRILSEGEGVATPRSNR